LKFAGNAGMGKIRSDKKTPSRIDAHVRKNRDVGCGTMARGLDSRLRQLDAESRREVIREQWGRGGSSNRSGLYSERTLSPGIGDTT